jgi:hypothetical protein
MRSEGCREGTSRFVVSHPCARKKAQGWGTEHLSSYRPVHLWTQLAGASQAAQDDSFSWKAGCPIPRAFCEGWETGISVGKGAACR